MQTFVCARLWPTFPSEPINVLGQPSKEKIQPCQVYCKVHQEDKKFLKVIDYPAFMLIIE